jgi:hypothetical protein
VVPAAVERPGARHRRIDLRCERDATYPRLERGSHLWSFFCASIYTGTAPDSPYLWITKGEEDEQRFLACVYVGGADGEEAEDPYLVADCGTDDLATESLRNARFSEGSVTVLVPGRFTTASIKTPDGGELEVRLTDGGHGRSRRSWATATTGAHFVEGTSTAAPSTP